MTIPSGLCNYLPTLWKRLRQIIINSFILNQDFWHLLKSIRTSVLIKRGTLHIGMVTQLSLNFARKGKINKDTYLRLINVNHCNMLLSSCSKIQQMVPWFYAVKSFFKPPTAKFILICHLQMVQVQMTIDRDI